MPSVPGEVSEEDAGSFPVSPTSMPKLITIDWEVVDKLCLFQSTEAEIARWFPVDIKTLHSHCLKDHGIPFSQYYEERSSKGKTSLRRKQFEMAMSGDRVMLIWLGKQYLSQCEKTEMKTKIEAAPEVAKEIDGLVDHLETILGK